MSQSLAQIYLHIVFSTQHRLTYLKDLELRSDLHAYLAGACKGQDSPALEVGGYDDHVHILYRLGKTMAPAVLVREIKRESSKWIKEQSPRLSEFHWQAGYGAFSISPAHVKLLREYILRQDEHHRQESFQDEFRRLCAKYELEIDERYVWD